MIRIARLGKTNQDSKDSKNSQDSNYKKDINVSQDDKDS